ncbi:MAG TPA: maleylpyruvate isomerase family mycothiol-dependent enzyme [Actinomycetota bacterium]|nr:maleylpyruvate isomerase family mycothiol-dependent enzyme [Actinomycetota bacterium]
MNTEIFDVLEAEQDRLFALLTGLDETQWAWPSMCPTWSVSDVVLHLAQSEEAVTASLEDQPAPIPVGQASNVDEAMEQWVRAERGARPGEVLARWDAARRAAVAGLRDADPAHPVQWAAAPLKPSTLATTRLAEHWIHTLDIADPLRIAHPDTHHLHHIAWLAHRTIGYAFDRAGRGPAPTVRAELTAPTGDTWVFGNEGSACLVTGPVGEFCRIAARRLDPQLATGIRATGERADEVLELVRTYA